MGFLAYLVLSASFASAQTPPATVTEHLVEAKIDSSKRLNRNITWKVKIDDPSACTMGIDAPWGLDGAETEGGKIENGKLTCTVGAGTELEFVKKERLRGYPFDAIIHAADGVPTTRTVINTFAPTYMPLGVWQGQARISEYASRGGYGVKHTFTKTDGTLRAAFSAYKDWTDASKVPLAAVKYKINKGSELGDLGILQGHTIGEITTAVYKALPLAPDAQPMAWNDKGLRKARDIIKDPGAGVNPTERALVLVSALKAAAFDAHIALFDTNPANDGVPLNLPTPSRYTQPAVAVVTKGRTVWIDPTSQYAPIPDPSVSMAGRPAWRIGDAPVRVPMSLLDEGEISISGTVVLGATENEVALKVSATGTTREMLRQMFAPLDEGARAAKVSEIAGAGRIGEVAITTKGLDELGPIVEIELTGKMKTEFQPFGAGLAGPQPSILAPGFAKAFPAEIRVVESLTVQPPKNATFFASNPADHKLDASVLIFRQLTGDPEEVQLLTVIDRLVSGADSGANAILDEQAGIGPTLMLMPSISGKTIKSTKTVATGNERAVLWGSLWYQANNAKKGDKMLAKAAKAATVEEVSGFLEKYTLEGDARPWNALFKTLSTEQDRLLVLNAMERKKLSREAWQFATGLTRSEDPNIKRQAFLAILRLQGDRPDPAVDKVGYNAWIKPRKLVKAARKASEAAGVQDAQLFALTAESLILKNKLMEARETLESAEEEGMTSTMVNVLSAELDSMEGAVVADVVRNVAEACAEEPMNSEIWRHAARAMNRIGRVDLAIEYGAKGARLAFDEPQRWIEVHDYALAGGDLETALQAAQHASNQHPTHRMSGIRLKLTALFAGDLELSNVGAKRGQQGEEFAIPELSVLFDQAGFDAALALLAHHDGAVIKDKDLLFARAEYLLEAGRYDEAARDGLLLARTHRQRDGEGLLFAANAGTYWNSPYAKKALDGAVSRSTISRRVRMEWALISGASDPRTDAYTLKRVDRKAVIVINSRSKADNVAMEVIGWEKGTKNPRVKAPAGFRGNTTLSGPTGVQGISNKVSGQSVLFLEQSLGMLPGPTGAMFSQPEMPIRTLLNGGNLYRLMNTRIPMYVAILYRDQGDLIGIGPTEQTAMHALDTALEADPSVESKW